MHVARPVADPQHLARVRLVGRDRVIARHLAALRVEPPASTLDTQPCRHHRAVHVQCQPGQSAVVDHVRHQTFVDFKQRLDPTFIESAQPAPQGVPTRQPGKSAQALHQRVVRQVTHVPHTPGACCKHRQDQHRQLNRAEVTLRQGTCDPP